MRKTSGNPGILVGKTRKTCGEKKYLGKPGNLWENLRKTRKSSGNFGKSRKTCENQKTLGKPGKVDENPQNLGKT